MDELLPLLCCPLTHRPLRKQNGELVADAEHVYAVSAEGIPLFAAQFLSNEGRAQRDHFDRVAKGYLENLTYPHTQEYTSYLDNALVSAMDRSHLGTVAELCCGRGEAFQLLAGTIDRGVGIDVSEAMLKNAVKENRQPRRLFVQGDATRLPLASACFDSVIMLGGVHHVSDRRALFGEIFRILKPGGHFYFREPVSDFFLWRWLRAIVYRLSPSLDHRTERPLQYEETVPVLRDAGMRVLHYRTHGLFGFCLLMNSDILIFNKLFRFVPGIRTITRWIARFDEMVLQLPGMRGMGLQVVGVAEKPRQV